MDMRVFKRAYAKVFAVECSREELAAVEMITAAEILRLGTGMQRYVDVGGRIPRILVFCFGSSAQRQKAPPGISDWVKEPFGQGAWLREMRAAIALFGREIPIRQIVVHELTHGLLDVLTDGFPYPIALKEGFARRAEYLLPDDAGNVKWERESLDQTRGDRRYWNAGDCVSIKDLVFFDVSEHWGQNMGAFLRMTEGSFWLNAYLFKVAKAHPRLKGILGELRLNNVRTAEGVYLWLQEVSGMGEEKLEESFHRFCTTGVVPDGGDAKGGRVL